MFLSEQSSGLAKHPEGVVSLAKLVSVAVACGAWWPRRLRVLLCRWFQDLLNGGELPNADEVESLEKLHG